MKLLWYIQSSYFTPFRLTGFLKKVILDFDTNAVYVLEGVKSQVSKMTPVLRKEVGDENLSHFGLWRCGDQLSSSAFTSSQVGSESFLLILLEDLKHSLRSSSMGVPLVPCHEGIGDVSPRGSFPVNLEVIQREHPLRTT